MFAQWITFALLIFFFFFVIKWPCTLKTGTLKPLFWTVNKIHFLLSTWHVHINNSQDPLHARPTVMTIFLFLFLFFNLQDPLLSQIPKSFTKWFTKKSPIQEEQVPYSDTPSSKSPNLSQNDSQRNPIWNSSLEFDLSTIPETLIQSPHLKSSSGTQRHWVPPCEHTPCPRLAPYGRGIAFSGRGNRGDLWCEGRFRCGYVNKEPAKVEAGEGAGGRVRKDRPNDGSRRSIIF